MTVTWIDRMAVDTRGEGDAVVFVHGLGGSMNVWTPLLPALTRYRCIRPELPGSGRSTRAYALGESAIGGGHLSVEVLADAVLRICEVLKISSFHLVGHSLGTIVAQHVAVKAGGQLRSLALFGAMAEPPAPVRVAMTQRASAARERGMFEIAEAVSQAALSASSRESQPVSVAYVRDSVASQDPDGYARSCIALAEAHSARLEMIGVPVLVVNGDEDVVTPLSGARHLADRLPSARLEVLPRCGHWPTLERTAECQRLLSDFLDRVR